VIGGDHRVWGTLGDLVGAEKPVYLYYAARANKKGYAWPTTETVAADVSVRHGLAGHQRLGAARLPHPGWQGPRTR
jgi:hypothetical protein